MNQIYLLICLGIIFIFNLSCKQLEQNHEKQLGSYIDICSCADNSELVIGFTKRITSYNEGIFVIRDLVGKNNRIIEVEKKRNASIRGIAKHNSSIYVFYHKFKYRPDSSDKIYNSYYRIIDNNDNLSEPYLLYDGYTSNFKLFNTESCIKAVFSDNQENICSMTINNKVITRNVIFRHDAQVEIIDYSLVNKDNFNYLVVLMNKVKDNSELFIIDLSDNSIIASQALESCFDRVQSNVTDKINVLCINIDQIVFYEMDKNFRINKKSILKYESTKYPTFLYNNQDQMMIYNHSNLVSYLISKNIPNNKAIFVNLKSKSKHTLIQNGNANINIDTYNIIRFQDNVFYFYHKESQTPNLMLYYNSFKIK